MAKSVQVDVAFTAEHHALLFGWLARAVVEEAGPGMGEPVVRRAVRRYGRERGGRMAARATADGHPLTLSAYVAYGEWRADPDAMEQAFAERAPQARLLVDRCPWHTVWGENGLLDHGRLYCLEIDQALVEGFNPNLELEVRGTRPNGAAQCDFLFHEALVDEPVDAPAARVMSWAYHLGHLYWSVREVVVEALGEAGERALERALSDFAARYGEEAVEAILAYRETDFRRPFEFFMPEVHG
jgi:hypothetical protein